MVGKWIPHEPTQKQAEFLYLPHKEALYGGAAGGGKSDALLMGGLQFVDNPNYAGLVIRRTFQDLAKPGAIMDRAHSWLRGTGARWIDRDHLWSFPGGGRLAFGYLQERNAELQYQSSEFQYIAFDELTQFEEHQYRYMLSRLRRREGSNVPLRMRGGTNPGGPGHAWVADRFNVYDTASTVRPYVPALLDDNPFVDAQEYRKVLAELDETLRLQLEKGIWAVDAKLKPYSMEWWRERRYDASKNAHRQRSVARYLSYDTASKTDDHNAYTALVVFDLMPDYTVTITHAWMDRVLGVDVADTIAEHAVYWNADGKLKGIIVEDESSGVVAIQALRQRRDWISRLVVAFNPAPFGDKLKVRPQRAATWCKRGCVLLPWPHDSVPWLHLVEQHIGGFPFIMWKDLIDALNQGIIYLENLLAEGWRAREGFNR